MLQIRTPGHSHLTKLAARSDGRAYGWPVKTSSQNPFDSRNTIEEVYHRKGAIKRHRRCIMFAGFSANTSGVLEVLFWLVEAYPGHPLCNDVSVFASTS